MSNDPQTTEYAGMEADGSMPYSFVLQDLKFKRARLQGQIDIVQEFIARAEAAEKENVCTIEVKPEIMEMLNEQN